jgi:dTDP-glucose pyrophosphorylase
MKTKSLIYSKDLSLEDVLKMLDINGNGVLPLVDDDNHLVGIITDGDIRRGILNKKSVLQMVNFSPKSISNTLSEDEIENKLKNIRKRHLPIVDDDKKLVDILILDEIKLKRNKNSIVIMAGGLGSRLGELTKCQPKPMLRVGEKPLLENMIEILRDQGFYNFYISVNYKANIIKEYFGDGSSFGVEIKYLEESERLGTAGALSLIEEKLKHPFFVINGDIITTQNFNNIKKFHNKKNATATMCVKDHTITNPYGVIKTQDYKIIKFEEKPEYNSLINAGIYLLNPEVLEIIPKNRYYDMPELFESLMNSKKEIVAYELKSYWIDIGHASDYERANTDMRAF